MKIVSVDYKIFHYNINSPIISSKSIIDKRESLLINIRFENNISITGEAAPLPKFSNESLTDVIKYLDNILPKLYGYSIDNNPFNNFNFINSFCKIPSLNFALQSIFLKYFLITDDKQIFVKNINNIKVNALLSLADNEVIKKTEELLNKGYTTIKFKMAVNQFDYEFNILSKIYSTFKDNLIIRLDPNSGFPSKYISAYMEKLNNINYEYIEDPVTNLDELFNLKNNLNKIALDSTNFTIDNITQIINKYNITTFILKPTLLGNIGGIIQLLTDTAYNKIKFIISSSFESYHSADILFYLASLRSNYAHGLDTFKLIDGTNSKSTIKNGYITKNNTFNDISKNSDSNIFCLFPNLNNSNNNVCFISTEKQVKYNEIFSYLTNLNSQYYIKPFSQVAIYNKNIIEFTKLIFHIFNFHSRPIIIDSRLNISEARKLAQNFNCNYLIEESNIIALDSKYSDSINLDLLLFTSGSTSFPKGVIISLNSIINSAQKFNNYFKVTSDNTFLASLPFNHIGGLMIMFRSLLAGAKIIVPNSTNYKGLKYSLENYHIDFVSLVPKQLQDLINDNVDLSKCKAVLLGGAKADSRLINIALKKGIKLYKVYGSTETCSMVTIASPEELLNNPHISGKPFPDIKIYVNNNNNLSKAPYLKGEIVVEADTLFDSYVVYNSGETMKLEKTNLYYTKDYGYLDNTGNLTIEGRLDDIIISGGENISPDEIRNRLLEIEAITDAIVIGVEDETWGKIPVAFIISNKPISEMEIKTELKSKLPKFKIPKRIIFIEGIPYNNNGKIDYNVLKSYLK
jgi:O-succinylbenzoic acid--CoA ligase